MKYFKRGISCKIVYYTGIHIYHNMQLLILVTLRPIEMTDFNISPRENNPLYCLENTAIKLNKLY